MSLLVEGSNKENATVATPMQLKLRPRVKKSPPPLAMTTPSSRGVKRGAANEATAPVSTKSSLQQRKDTSNVTTAGPESLVSPQLGGTTVLSKSPLRRSSSRATPRNNGIYTNFITPHTTHTLPEHDVGLTLLASLASISGQTGTSPNGFSYKLNFPEIIYKMVMETTESDPEVIHWILNGEAFVIFNKNKKLGQILQKYFRHGKYGSLQRQLNMYGWKKHVRGRYDGAFHNPDFHRDTTRGELIHILRRGPPVHSAKKTATKKTATKKTATKKGTKIMSAARNGPEDPESDDEWQPGKVASAATVWKERSARISKKVDKKSLEDSDDDSVEAAQTESTSDTNAKAGSGLGFGPTGKPLEEMPKPSKIFRQSVANHDDEGARIMNSVAAKQFTPLRARVAETPGAVGVGLLYFEADSPTEHWSPFIGGLARQENAAAIKSVGFVRQESDTSVNAGGSNRRCHSGETYWTPWRQPPHHPGAAFGSETAWHTSDISPWASSPGQVRPTYAIPSQYPQENANLSFRPTHGVSARAGDPPSPSGVCPTNFAPTLSRSLASGRPLFSRENSAAFPTLSRSLASCPPLFSPENSADFPVLSRENAGAFPVLSRESSGAFPVPLVQRVSSSFFLPFLGMTETLSFALEPPNEGAPAT